MNVAAHADRSAERVVASRCSPSTLMTGSVGGPHVASTTPGKAWVSPCHIRLASAMSWTDTCLWAPVVWFERDGIRIRNFADTLTLRDALTSHRETQDCAFFYTVVSGTLVAEIPSS
jgi:hypothetical protein